MLMKSLVEPSKAEMGDLIRSDDGHFEVYRNLGGSLTTHRDYLDPFDKERQFNYDANITVFRYTSLIPGEEWNVEINGRFKKVEILKVVDGPFPIIAYQSIGNEVLQFDIDGNCRDKSRKLVGKVGLMQPEVTHAETLETVGT